MKTITRVLCLVLCLVMLAPMLVACAAKELTYGPQINMYLSTEVYNFDPAYAYLDANAVKVLGLMFEGLMKFDDDGNLKKAMCTEWEYTEDEGILPDDTSDDEYKLVVKLKTSAWSDGRAVSADQFVFAWKRLLDPEFDGEGAELLYDIKGAWERKNEMMSPDDVGLEADKKVLTIKFAHPVDPEAFLRKTANIALAPLREDIVEHYYNWSSANTTIATNGQYTLLAYYPGDSLMLARNTYYNHDITEEDELPAPMKYVKPYLINIDYRLNAEEMMQRYEEGQLFYIGELPASREIREQYKSRAKITETFATHMYYFNTNVDPFNNPEVRKILSSVISRNDLAAEVVFAKPATGVVPGGIHDLTKKDDFAANNASKLSGDATMSISEAKSALSKAGVNPASYGTFKLTVRTNADGEYSDDTGTHTLHKGGKIDEALAHNTVDYVMAKKVIDIWNQLGFKFEINGVNTAQYNEATSSIVQYRDCFVETLFGTYGDGIQVFEADPIVVERAQFDVIAIDYQLMEETALSALSVYATYYAGSMLNAEENPMGHITGYNSEAYNKLIDEARALYVAGDKEGLSAKLHEAETLILNDMPIMPLIVYQNAVLVSNKLSGVKFDYWGSPIITKANLKNWKDFLIIKDE
ncbi:MAG: hypothetical protein E7634_04765 [Ruminococcaceae bacterium]|nr:hypothetical protein [Oscillospiraceae bacterium]